MVPADWQHPKEYNAHRGEECYRPMFASSYSEAFKEWRYDDLPRWLAAYDQWQQGMTYDYHEKTFVPIDWDKMSAANNRGKAIVTYEDYAGVSPRSPDPANYMPDWPAEQRTHYMMYEDTSEGTPISPAFATPEELARWLTDNGASAFGSSTASYEGWLRVARGGYACSAVISNGVMQSGVDGLTEREAAP
jgi:hypothetical protein